MQKEVKKHIDTADEKVVKKIWWDELPDNIKADAEAALAEAERGDLIPHEEIKKRYSKWIAK